MVNVHCLCPRRPDGAARHPDGDDVTLRDRLDFVGAHAARNVKLAVLQDNPSADVADYLAALIAKYLLHGVAAWTLVDASGRPIPVTKAAIAQYLLSDDVAATLVGDAADEAYSPQVLLPLGLAALTSSPDMPTGASTSAPMDSTSPSQTPSSPSSTTTSRTDAIAPTTSPRAGVSSSSPS